MYVWTFVNFENQQKYINVHLFNSLIYKIKIPKIKELIQFVVNKYYCEEN